MPLKRGKSRQVIEQNAREMMAAGRPEDQAWAAAYDKARESGARLPRKRRKR